MKSPPGKITSDLFKGLSAHPFPSPLPTLLSGQSVVFSFNILFIYFDCAGLSCRMWDLLVAACGI